MIWVFAIACGICGVIGMAAGWLGRGAWDKAGRIIERTQLPQRRRITTRKGPVTDDEWDQIVDTIRRDK